MGWRRDFRLPLTAVRIKPQSSSSLVVVLTAFRSALKLGRATL
jgi:hypothetical protein